MIEPIALLAAAGVEQLIGQVITTIITFVIVVVVMKMLAWGPILEVLDARKKEVTDRFSEIDEKLASANAKQKDYESKLANINEEAREIQNKAIEEGRKIATDIEAKAKVEAEKIIAKAKSDMNIQVEQARITLRRETIEMTLAATGKLLAVELNDDRHREMVEGFVTELSNQESNG